MALIAWRAFAYWLAPAKLSWAHRFQPPPPNATEVWRSRRAEAAWLVDERDAHAERLERAREIALSAFCAHLDPQGHPMGVADALLSVLVVRRGRVAYDVV